jgi:RNA polymerase sigma-70 factor (ECF subfamily)
MRATLSVPTQGSSTLAPGAGVSVHRCAAVARVDLAQPHVPRLVHVARRILGSDDLAWDAVQESLILLWHEQHAPGDLVGWLVRTVVHRSLHHARSQRRRRAHEERGGGPGAYGGERCDPVANAQLRELAEHIEQALAQVPEPFHSPLRLRDVEGLDYEQIAQRLELPLGTVRSRLHRGRSLLRARLAERVHDAAQCWICELDSIG